MLKGPIEQREELALGALVRLLRDWETEPYPLHAVLPSGRFVPNRVRLLVDFLADKFESLLLNMTWEPASSAEAVSFSTAERRSWRAREIKYLRAPSRPSAACR
jgi:hypothetical protein